MTGVHLIVTMAMNTALFINDLAIKHSDSYVGLPEGFTGIHIISYYVYREVVLYNYNITYVYTWYVYIMVEIYNIFKMTYIIWYNIMRLFPYVYIYIEIAIQPTQHYVIISYAYLGFSAWSSHVQHVRYRLHGGQRTKVCEWKSTSNMGRF